MRMTSIPAIVALFAAACSPQQAQDPAAPARYLEVSPPDWTASLTLNVRKRSCTITNAAGESFRIARSGTDIGGGLIATRDKNDCYVRDESGVQCNWNRAERIDWCRMENPQYNAYLTARSNLKF